MATLDKQELNLSRQDKKVARAIIEKGLMREFAKGLADANFILHEWEKQVRDSRDSYHLLFKTIKEFDKHIARRYDAVTGSKYIFVIAGQLMDGIINEDDLSEFSDSAKQTILKIANDYWFFRYLEMIRNSSKQGININVNFDQRNNNLKIQLNQLFTYEKTTIQSNH